jgi:callose synthase
MAQTILVGGAKYRATGRGFVTQHTPMDEQYRFFASSHLYLGVELAAGLILMGVYTDAGQYGGRTWSLWLASVSFLASPFWFNPLTFDWNCVSSDYALWLRWMRGSSGGGSKSWSMWWNEENAYYKKMPLVSKLFFMIKASLHVLVGEGIRRSDLFKQDISLSSPPIGVDSLLIILVVLFVLGRVFSANESSMPYPIRRTIGIMIFVGILASVITLFIEDTNYLRYALAAYYDLGAVCLIGLLSGFKFVKYFYFIHDIVCAHIIFAPLFLLAALQLPGHIQTWLLYHNALSTNVVVSDILRYARKNKDSGGGQANEDLVEQVAELRKLVQRQDQILSGAGLSDTTSLSSQAPEAVAPELPAGRTAPTGGRSYGRAISMSGMDVWGDMALGDVGEFSYNQGAAPAESSQPTSSVRSNTNPQGFSFSSPDTMPPR